MAKTFPSSALFLVYRTLCVKPPKCAMCQAFTVCGRLMGKVTDSWLACHEFEPSASEEPPYTGELFKSAEPQTSFRWCGVEVKRQGTSSGVVLVT
ncbi:hypothetical protein TNCV_1823561 [Trichonephila clavipes]|nr:hypothetical protein TNCV_1823561 [Trichonephila clavipes]